MVKPAAPALVHQRCLKPRRERILASCAAEYAALLREAIGMNIAMAFFASGVELMSSLVVKLARNASARIKPIPRRSIEACQIGIAARVEREVYAQTTEPAADVLKILTAG